MRLILMFLALLVFAGCEDGSPLATAQTTNNSIPVQLLFENDGCKVYSFYYHYNYHYYANCAPGMVENPQGKSHYDDSVPTTM